MTRRRVTVERHEAGVDTQGVTIVVYLIRDQLTRAIVTRVRGSRREAKRLAYSLGWIATTGSRR